jgi:type IV pilus assembly protein PilV
MERIEMKRRHGGFQTGFSFIELSVATAIFSMGLGSLSLMMLAAILGTAEARHHTVASSQADSMAEMIAMSSDAFGHYIFPVGEPAGICNEEACPGQSMAAANLAKWLQTLRDELPGGDGLVCRDSTPGDGEPGNPSCDGAGPLVIKIFWEESRHSQSANGGMRRVVSRLPW